MQEDQGQDSAVHSPACTDSVRLSRATFVSRGGGSRGQGGQSRWVAAWTRESPGDRGPVSVPPALTPLQAGPWSRVQGPRRAQSEAVML